MSSEVSNQPHRPPLQDSFSFDATATDSTQPRPKTMTDPSTPCMQLKGSLVPMTVLELNRFDPVQFEQDLRAKVAQAPDFFENLPVILSLEKMSASESPDFAALQQICQQFSVRVVAIRGGNETMQQSARQIGLGILAAQKERAAPVEPSAPVAAAVEIQRETVEVVRTVVQKEVQTERQISKIVHHPIRSGQQVYAADGDLIIMASVSAGAEILADGNIHVYGALRGRALAGVKGNVNARIFCYSMEAELISIAGQYKINEDMDHKALRKPTQVYLDNDALKLVEIEF